MNGWHRTDGSSRELPRWFFPSGSIALLLVCGFAGQYFSPTIRQLPWDEAVPDPSRQHTASDPIVAWQSVEDFDRPLAQFRTVFWEPLDTVSLRGLIRESTLVRGKRVLEIGTGTGLLALCCLNAGAQHVVATDVNSAALANARFNAAQLGLADGLETRQVPLDRSGAFTVIGDNERFDLIVSNPPWENQRPGDIGEYALYDERFRLMRSLLASLRDYLAPDGRALLAYGCNTAIRELLREASRHGLEATLRDERSLDDLPETFLPGMMIEIRAYGRSTSR